MVPPGPMEQVEHHINYTVSKHLHVFLTVWMLPGWRSAMLLASVSCYFWTNVWEEGVHFRETKPRRRMGIQGLLRAALPANQVATAHCPTRTWACRNLWAEWLNKGEILWLSPLGREGMDIKQRFMFIERKKKQSIPGKERGGNCVTTCHLLPCTWKSLLWGNCRGWTKMMPTWTAL